jgi:predicted nucleic acid-binding protein
MKIYLDNCSYSRPFDDKKQLSIRMEAEAKLQIQENIRGGVYELVWSYMNDFENSENPFEERREAIGMWAKIANQHCPPSDNILEKAKHIQKAGIRAKDALNLACAIASNCDFFITTDRGIIKKSNLISEIRIINPIDFVREEEESNGNGN